jgi:hypothetical protein
MHHLPFEWLSNLLTYVVRHTRTTPQAQIIQQAQTIPWAQNRARVTEWEVPLFETAGNLGK